MPSRGRIDVQVHVDKQPLPEFLDPVGGNDNDHQTTRFIEAKAGQKFKVTVTLLPGFHFQKANHICVEFQIDNEPAIEFATYAYHEVEARRGAIIVPTTCHFDDTKICDRITGRWNTSEYEFGALAVDQDAALPNGLSLEDVDRLGSIRVRVFRAEQKKLRVPSAFDGIVQQPLDEISEKALKGKAIKNNVKYAIKEATTAYEPKFFEYLPVNGPRGTPFEFVFLYRNRKILQSLGCIPRSPSPPPDPTLMLQRTEDMLKLMKQHARERNLENMELRERLARAESGSRASSVIDLESNSGTLVGSREVSVKTEIGSENTVCYGRTPTMKTERMTSIPPPPLFANNRQEAHALGNLVGNSKGSKRTREEAMGGDEDELLEVAPPTTKPRVVVDLTED